MFFGIAIAFWFVLLAIQDLQWLAEAGNTSLHLPNLSEKRSGLLLGRNTGMYTAVLGGYGKVTDGWPRFDQWVHSFEDMFENNRAVISASCSQWALLDNSDDETDSVKNAIHQVEQSSGVDARFILSIVMQESNGCVRIQTTDNGVTNPGLMQSHEGSGSCNKDGIIQSPCPESQILQMIVDGVEGTQAGPGLKTLLAEEGGKSDVASFYKAARAYNSGTVASSGNLGQGGATHCYASDIANRLLGWTDGPSLCAPDIIGMMSTAQWDRKGAADASDRDTISTSTRARLVTQSHDAYSFSLLSNSSSLPSIPVFANTFSALLPSSTGPCGCKRKHYQA